MGDNTKCSHKPELCKKSKKIASQASKGTFFQRVAKDALRKEHAALRQKAQANNDPDCTFKPKINEDAKKRRARTALEMSRGDSLKKETNARLLKLKSEQDELAGLTFQPQI